MEDLKITRAASGIFLMQSLTEAKKEPLLEDGW